MNNMQEIQLPQESYNDDCSFCLEKTIDNNGVLVNHFYTGRDTIFSAPLKAVEIDNEGILRLKPPGTVPAALPSE